MESAAIAANGFRFRVPYGTLLCVSDKPLHGEIKLAGMADEFYRQRVGQHLEIGLKALEKLKAQEWERLHSRKLRSFEKSHSNSLIGGVTGDNDGLSCKIVRCLRHSLHNPDSATSRYQRPHLRLILHN